MNKLLIKSCKDRIRWYVNLIGQTVDYLGDVGNEWNSREPNYGYINFVQYYDAEIVIVEDIYICVWPNYDWCYQKDVEDYGCTRSDDYRVIVIEIPDTCSDDEVFIDNYLRDMKPQG